MDLSWRRGNKHKKDRILEVTTRKNEWFSIYKLALLANQLTINEKIINKEKIENGRFLFKEAIFKSIEMGAIGIDWAEEENIDIVKVWCRDHILKFENIEKDLRKTIQMRLEEYGIDEME